MREGEGQIGNSKRVGSEQAGGGEQERSRRAEPWRGEEGWQQWKGKRRDVSASAAEQGTESYRAGG